MMKIENFFLKPKSVSHRQYEALRMYYIENIQAVDVADYFGYKYRAFTSIVSDFRRDFDQDDGIEDTLADLKREKRVMLEALLLN
jgi:hypothetical protein